MAYDLQQALRDAAPNATVSVPTGIYLVNLVIEKPVVLIAMGAVTLNGCGEGTVVRIHTAGVVRLVGFLIGGGNTTQRGGGVCVTQGDVELVQCTLRYNKAPLDGGGGLGVSGDATVAVTRCRFEGNTGRQGAAILADGVCSLKVTDSALIQNAGVEGGALRVREGAKAEVFGCTIADNKVVGEHSTGSAMSLGGTMTRAPSLTVSHCVVSEREQGPECISNFAKHPGALTLTRNVLPPWCAALGGDNDFAAATFTYDGTEPYLLTQSSPGVGAAAVGGFTPGAKDLAGKPREVAGGRPTLGAFATVKERGERQ